MGMGMGLPPGQGPDFGGSLRRLLGGLRPEAPLVAVVIVLAVVSVTFAVLGPKILGDAINLIFEGAISAQLPAGATDGAGRRRPPAAGPGPARRHAVAACTLTPGRASTSRRSAGSCCSSSRSTCSARCSPGCRPTSWPGSRSERCSGCAPTSTRSSDGCRCGTSTATRAATCSAASPTTSTTSASRSSRA